jgi:hypothetical protein
MAKVPLHRRVASNPRRAAKPTKGSPAMTATQKKAFVARMAKARKNPSNKGKKKSSPKRNGARKNPACKPARRNPQRRNPTILSNPKEMAINIVAALLSAVATRQLPQMLLGTNNTGWQGYLANLGAGMAATFAAHEFVSPAAAGAALIGSGVIVLDRVLTEQFSPVGQYLSLTGLGDATAATSLGTVSDGFYIHPTIYNSNGQPIIPHEITDAAVAAFNMLPPKQLPAAHTMAGTSHAATGRAAAGRTSAGRFASRF